MKVMLLALAGAVLLTGAGAPDPGAVKEVTAAMESLKQAMIKKDGAALEKLLGDELTYTHSAGQEETKAEFIKSIASGKSIVERLDLSKPSVRVYGSTALYKSGVDLYHSSTNIVHMNILHVWVKGPSGWKLVARQATRLNPASH
ncbi:MAG: nuclear transport factor 2 family protein [Acidobacteria bacterium]|nr:nuclear transport factor 2 family protein [Acidobacteriota bacterium]